MTFGACCPRCNKTYLTTVWPGMSLCAPCRAGVERAQGRAALVIPTVEELIRRACAGRRAVLAAADADRDDDREPNAAEQVTE